MVKPEPEERATLDEIFHEKLKNRVYSYITSWDFKSEWEESHRRMLLVDNQFQLHETKISEEEINNALEDYYLANDN